MGAGFQLGACMAAKKSHPISNQVASVRLGRNTLFEHHDLNTASELRALQENNIESR